MLQSASDSRRCVNAITVPIVLEDETTPLLEESEPWLFASAGQAVRTGARLGVPPASLALYGRWWQLEAWLRELVYVELRAHHGRRWDDVVRAASGRQSDDATYTHMQSADTRNPLAYLDYSQIVRLIDDNWSMFDYALLTKKAWDGRQEELKRIRHRIGHMRRPHPDDLGRLEQTLRDLERGTFVALASYNDGETPDPDEHDDAVTRGWVLREHEDARRLIGHAARQYETKLLLRSSARPWVPAGQRAGHGSGHLWHADFLVGGRSVDAASLWYDTLVESIRPLIVHMSCFEPYHVGFTFSGADDDTAVADAIGVVFDAVLMNATIGVTGLGEELEAWRRAVRDVDFRLLVESRWMFVESTTLPISIFGAGGAVRSNPGW